MPAHRLTMRKTREILRLSWGARLSARQVARSCKISPTTVRGCVARASLAGLSWPLPAELDDEQLERLLYPPPKGKGHRPLPDFAHIHRELRKKGVTQELLWQEYKATYPEQGYQYSRFCELYHEWKGRLDVVMRQPYKAGEKQQVDYAGAKIEVVDPKTGQVTEHPVFVAVLCASNFTYAEAQRDASLRCWLDGHIHAFEYFGGVCEITVPDNLKTGVTRPSFYEPDLNPTYHELAKHYDTAIIPARVRRPRDKAKVENSVQQVQRWVLAPLRHQTFFSLEEANEAIAEKLEQLNDRPFFKLRGCRRSLYEQLDKPALKPLPLKRFEMSSWKPKVGVNIDYHVEIDRHYYSVPHQLIRQRVDVRITATIIECFHKGRRVASHVRSRQPGGFTTDPAHRPKAHQRTEWPPSRLIRWASHIGPQTEQMVTKLLEHRPHPEQGYRSCLGVIRLCKRYDEERLERACERALAVKSYRYRSVESILKSGLDSQPPMPSAPSTQPSLPLDHENIRGSDYYH